MEFDVRTVFLVATDEDGDGDDDNVFNDDVPQDETAVGLSLLLQGASLSLDADVDGDFAVVLLKLDRVVHGDITLVGTVVEDDVVDTDDADDDF